MVIQQSLVDYFRIYWFSLFCIAIYLFDFVSFEIYLANDLIYQWEYL